MSTYYSFYIGYRTKEKKFHAFGPYDKFNNLHPALCLSRSFVSDLYEDFYRIDIKDMDDFLKGKFVYKVYQEELVSYLYYLPVDKLPDTDYMKRGYYPVDEIVEYLEDSDHWDYYFSERYTETEYSIKLSTAIKNNDTEELERLKKFNYFSYPDYNCKEYDSSILHKFINYNGPFDSYCIEHALKENNEELDDIVILLEIS